MCRLPGRMEGLTINTHGRQVRISELLCSRVSPTSSCNVCSRPNRREHSQNTSFHEHNTNLYYQATAITLSNMSSQETPRDAQTLDAASILTAMMNPAQTNADASSTTAAVSGSVSPRSTTGSTTPKSSASSGKRRAQAAQPRRKPKQTQQIRTSGRWSERHVSDMIPIARIKALTKILFNRNRRCSSCPVCTIGHTRKSGTSSDAPIGPAVYSYTRSGKNWIQANESIKTSCRLAML